jgi:hypothetical protein
MSWLYSQALVAEYLGENFLDGEQSAPLNGKPTPQAYCSLDKMMEVSRLSRYGMTFKPLMESLGQELLTLYLADFHVKTLVPQEKAQELMESDQECGEKWRASFVKFDPNTSLWRTHQCSLLGDLDEFLETWPQWGLMRDGECWEQKTLEQTIRGTEFGLSPNGLDYFHTPNTTGLDGGSNSRRALKKRMEMIPTPTARDGSGVRGKAAQERKNNPIDTVPIYVQKFPTPQSNDAKNAVVRHRTKSLQIMLGGTIATENPELIGGQLNPMWVEWLMGWPLGWTDLKPLEMDKFHCAPQQHGES